MPYKDKERQRQYKHDWDIKNKDRYKRRHIARLGNPKQDEDILRFIKKKRNGEEIKRYKPLPDFVFKHNNHAFYPEYCNEIISGDISFD